MTPTGIEPVLPPWKGDVLTAWPWSRIIHAFSASVTFSKVPIEMKYSYSKALSASSNNLSDVKIHLAPRVGLEPTTTRLTAECSTIELSRIISRYRASYEGYTFKTELET